MSRVTDEKDQLAHVNSYRPSRLHCTLPERLYLKENHSTFNEMACDFLDAVLFQYLTIEWCSMTDRMTLTLAHKLI